MRIKKKACTALAVCVAVVSTGISAFAQVTEVGCDVNYGVISFSGNTDVPEKRVTYTAFMEGSDNILSIGEPAVNEDGSFVIEVGLDASGDYKILIKDASGSIYEKAIDGYICIDDRCSILLNMINTGDREETEAALDEINLSFEQTEWAKIKDKSLKSWLLEYISEHRTYEDIEELESEYVNLNALYIINKSKVASIVSEVRKYAEVLGISDDSEVKSFLSEVTNAKTSALVRELGNSPATTPQMLETAVKKANDAKKSGGSSGGGGGSSGGGGGRGTSVSIETGNESAVKPDTEKEPIREKGSFSDVSGEHWAKEAVEALAEKGIISGFGDGTFKPDNNVTREEFVKMAVVAFGIPYEGKSCAFLDVFENDWFRPYVGAAQEYGLVNGIADDIFGIHKEITRQDAAVILKRIADYKGIALDAIREYDEFTDGNEIGGYAADAVKDLYCGGVISGKGGGYFAPEDTCTRAEAAKMIYGIVEGGSYE